MPSPYVNARVAAYNVNTDGSIDTSVYILEDLISISDIPVVTLELIPPSGYEIKGISPSTGWSSYVFTSSPITYEVTVPGPQQRTDVDFTISIWNPTTKHTLIIDPRFTVKNTMSGTRPR